MLIISPNIKILIILLARYKQEPLLIFRRPHWKRWDTDIWFSSWLSDLVKFVSVSKHVTPNHQDDQLMTSFAPLPSAFVHYSFTPRLQQTTSSAHIFSKSKVQNLKCGWENIWRKVVHIHHLDNVSSNIFQNVLSVLADVTAKIPKWRRWGWMS
jgi:hypothetical protein